MAGRLRFFKRKFRYFQSVNDLGQKEATIESTAGKNMSYELTFEHFNQSAEAENQASRHTGHKLGFGNEQPYMWLKYNQHKLNGKEP